MCLIVVAWQVHPRFPLVLASNRDEFHARPSAPAGPHPLAPRVLGGRDLEKGGSWLLAAPERLAAVTNVRDGRAGPESTRRSRGELVHTFALGVDSGAQHHAALAPVAGDFGRFNLLTWDGADLYFAGNHPRFRGQTLPPGIHGLSNGEFDAPWPKVERLRAAMAQWLADPAPAAGEPSLDLLFAGLADRERAADGALPDTGVGLEWERLLSSPFIAGEHYGTRASTVVLAGPDGVQLFERRFGPGGMPEGRQALRSR